MIKVVGSNAWSGSLWSEGNPRSAIIKRASNGISGIDKQAFVKRACASSGELLDKLDKIEVKPGEELVHLIALGSTEAYGPNRNGDGFSKKACRKYHPCFVKEAKVYRDHKNTDKSKSYGIVKASAFNEEMSRVELIVALNATKEAAKANKGLVADKEMEKLAAGKDIPWSMACTVPFDVCSCCGNKASTQSEYCKGTNEGGLCKAGGLKNNMGKVVSVDGEIKQLYADNTQPNFFDISHVFVPADRIAYSSGRLTKHASSENPMNYSGAELAKQLCVTGPESSYSNPKVAHAISLMKRSSELYKSCALREKRASFLAVMNFKPLVDTAFPRRYKFASVQKVLQDLQVCLTPSQYVQLLSEMPLEKSAALGEIIAPLSNEYIETMDAYEPVSHPAVSAPKELYKWAFAQQLPSTNPSKMFKQAALNSVAEAPDNKFSVYDIYSMKDDPGIMQLAKGYALYKVAFIANLPSELQESASELIIGRDYLSF